MAGVKISALPVIPSAVALSDIYPTVQVGTTYKATISQLSTLLSSTLTLNTVAQVTGLPAALAGFVPLAGGIMTGALILNTSSPTTPLQAASKGYVDTVAAGFTVILSAFAGTTVNLNTTSAGAGVGATLTNNGALAAFSVDGVSPAINARILVKNQTLSQHNGVYNLTTVGSGAVAWVLTRATDYDSNTEIKPGTLIAVDNGTANANTSWLETATVVTVDTDPILFSQFTFAPSAFLQIVNNLSELTGTAATARANIGLGNVSTKAASDVSKATVAMVTGAFTIGHVATFSDVNGTIQDGGAPSGTVTSVATAGLATGGTITTTGTITVTGATQADQETSTSNAVVVTPGVQQFHPSAAKAWVKFQGNPVVIFARYNVTSVVRAGAGNYTITFTTPFSSANAYSAFVNSSGNSGGTNGSLITTYTASTVVVRTEDGSGFVDPSFVNMIAFGDQ